MASSHPPSIPAEMRALRIIEFHKPWELRTIPVPKPGPHDLLVKIAVASYCHTDSMTVEGVYKGPVPQTAFHESAGTVVAVGTEVNSFEIGDRVMCGIPLHLCGECDDCTSPDAEDFGHYCTRITGHIGVTTQGCAADYAICDARMTTKLPDSVSFIAASPLACAGRTIYRAVDQTGLKPGQWVAIVGSGGGLGHLGIQFARAKGLKVVAVDARDTGLAVSVKYGSDVVVDARKGKEAAVKEVQAATGGRGVDCAIVLADHAEALAAAMTRMHGTVIQVAQPDNVTIPFEEFIFRDIRLRGTLVGSAKDSRNMVQCIADNDIKVRTNIFHGLDSIWDLMHKVESGTMQGKAVIIIDQEQIEAEKKIGAAAYE